MKMLPLWLRKPVFLLFTAAIYLFFSRIGRMILLAITVLSVAMMAFQIRGGKVTADFGLWFLIAYGTFSLWWASHSMVSDMKSWGCYPPKETLWQAYRMEFPKENRS